MKNQAGFTLLELIAVLILISIFLGFSVPIVMSTLDSAQQKSSLKKVIAALRYARSEAIATKSIYEFNGDIDSQEFFVESKDGADTKKSRQLKDVMQFNEFIKGDQSLDEGSFSILFFPQGTSSGGTIVLSPKGSTLYEETVSIEIDLITGKPMIEYADDE